MWATILSFVSKFMPTKMKNSLFYTIPIIVIGVWIIILKIQLSDLEKENEALSVELNVANISLENAKGKIEILNSEKILQEEATTGVNNLLEMCYKKLNENKIDFQEIEKNMNLNSGNSVSIEDISYEKITDEQNTAGINFVNRQLTGIK